MSLYFLPLTMTRFYKIFTSHNVLYIKMVSGALALLTGYKSGRVKRIEKGRYRSQYCVRSFRASQLNIVEFALNTHPLKSPPPFVKGRFQNFVFAIFQNPPTTEQKWSDALNTHPPPPF